MHLVDAMRGFLWFSRRTADCHLVGELGLAAARRSGDGLLEAAMHRTMGHACHMLGGHDDAAAEHYTRALRYFEREGEWRSVACLHANLGLSNVFLGNTKLAVDHQARAAAIADEHGYEDIRVPAVLGMILSYVLLGRLAEAADLAERIRAGHPQRALALNQCGVVHREQGKLEQALDEFAAARSLYREAGYRSGELHVQVELGHAMLLAGDTGEALKLLRATCAAAEECEDQRTIAEALTVLMVCEHRLGRYEAARALGERAVRVLRKAGSPHKWVEAFIGLADVHRSHGDLAQAARCAREALSLAERHDLRYVEGRARRAQAVIDLAGGRLDDARAEATCALTVHRNTGQRLFEAGDLLLLAEIDRRTGRADPHEGVAERIVVEVAGNRAEQALRAMRAGLANT